MIKKAVVIVGHGSKLKGFQAAMVKVAQKLRQEKKFHWVWCAYLEITPPSIPAAIQTLVKKGATEIRVLPYFLLLGRHIREDMPRIVKEARKKYGSRVKIKLCPYLGYDPKLVSLVKQRIGNSK